MQRTLTAFWMGLLLSLSFASTALAQDWTLTGTGTRVKTVAFVDVDVYQAQHFVKGGGLTKSKAAIVDADVDKRVVLTMLRDVEAEKFQGAFKDGFALNGYSDAAKIGKFIGVFKAEILEKQKVTIVYDAAKKTTTITAPGGSATVEGVEFMKAVWRLWFGKIDQPKLGDQLIQKLP